MNGKMMTLTNVELYTVDIKNHDNSFSILVNLCKQRCAKSVESYKYLNKFIS